MKPPGELDYSSHESKRNKKNKHVEIVEEWKMKEEICFSDSDSFTQDYYIPKKILYAE